MFGRGAPPDIDWETASRYFRPRGPINTRDNAGVVIIEQWPETEVLGTGSILLGASHQLEDSAGSEFRLAPDVGTVLAAHGSTELIPGDVVLFNHEHGKRMGGFWLGDYMAMNDVRFFGRYVEDSDQKRCRALPWSLSIFARLTDLEAGLENCTIRPQGDWVLVKRDPLHDKHAIEGTSMVIHLTKSATHRPSMGEVVEAGPDADLEPGDRVLYMANVTEDIEPLHPILAPGYRDENLVMMRAEAILSVLVDEPMEMAA